MARRRGLGQGQQNASSSQDRTYDVTEDATLGEVASDGIGRKEGDRSCTELNAGKLDSPKVRVVPRARR